MKRLLPALLLLFAFPASAHAAAPSCQRDGGMLLAANGKTRVVSVKEKPTGNRTRQDHIYGCWTTTGRRFTLFTAVNIGEDEVESDEYTIVGGRYIGVIRTIEGGASEDLSSATFDANQHKALYTSKPCDAVDRGDSGGIDDAVFLRNGAMAYSCFQLHLVNQQGDKLLEPAGTPVEDLAASFGRLYWTVNGVAKSLAL